MAAVSISGSIPFSGEVDFSSVPQHPAGYVRIPKYVFENCNQQVCNSYDDAFLEKIKLQAQKLTPEMRALMKRVYDKATRIKKEEELDWVYGLDYLEKYLSDPAFRQKQTPFTIDEIIHINGLLSRCANKRPGKFRKLNIFWSKGNWGLSYGAAYGIFQQELLKAHGESIEDELTSELTRKISDPSCSKRPVLEVKISKLHNRMLYLKAHPEETQDRDTGGQLDVSRIDPEKAYEWGKNYPGKKKGTIDAVRWLKDYFHFFPPGKQIRTELQKDLDTISSDGMHQIEKACRIWFDIVRIHISHEANKREGKALGSIILLAFGYLPPEISGEDGKRYVKLLQEGFEKEDGHIPFMHFIVEQMKKTYAKYSAIPGYLEQYQSLS